MLSRTLQTLSLLLLCFWLGGCFPHSSAVYERDAKALVASWQASDLSYAAFEPEKWRQRNRVFEELEEKYGSTSIAQKPSYQMIVGSLKPGLLRIATQWTLLRRLERKKHPSPRKLEQTIQALSPTLADTQSYLSAAKAFLDKGE